MQMLTWFQNLLAMESLFSTWTSSLSCTLTAPLFASKNIYTELGCSCSSSTSYFSNSLMVIVRETYYNLKLVLCCNCGRWKANDDDDKLGSFVDYVVNHSNCKCLSLRYNKSWIFKMYNLTTLFILTKNFNWL